MPAYVCQPDAVELCPCGMGGQATRSRGHNDGAKALREVDTEGHQEHGGDSFENARF